MYAYALLTDDDICHTVIECSDERTDIVDKYVILDEYDIKYLSSRWTGSEWDFPPDPQSRWNGTEWSHLSKIGD